MRTYLMGLATLATLAMASMGASAQELQSTHQYWNVFTIKQDGSKVCYMASSPIDKKGNYKRRSAPYLLVTVNKQDNDEVSTSSGYPYKTGSHVAATIDGKKYRMFTKGELAWASDSATDKAMVGAMKRGSKITIKGNSRLGTYSADTYSLSGFTAAHKKMRSLCK